MKITAVIPVRDRAPLVKRTIKRVMSMGCDVVCTCSTQEEKRIIDWAGGHAQVVSRMELGRKWNIAYQMAKDTNCDAVFHLGSDDWFSDNWIKDLSGWLDNYDVVGITDYYFAHFHFHINRLWDGFPVANAKRNVYVMYWPGYTSEHRMGEPVGGGRLIRSDVLDMIDWQPFDNKSVKNLDFEMMKKIKEKGGTIKAVKDEELRAISITTNLWPCKNGLVKMQEQCEELKEDFLKKHFPEVYQVWSL
jgi:hypothetical protein